jgi:hypothetical protein
VSEFPKEYFYQIKNNGDLEVSVVVGYDEFKFSYWVECNLLIKSSRKIFKGLGKKFNLQDEEYALSEGLRIYRNFLASE